MYNFNITKYYNINSLLHNMNPLYKIICLLIFTFIVLFTNNLSILLLLLIFTLILIKMSNVPLTLYLKNLLFSLGISIFIVIINIITNISITNTIVSLLKLLLFILYAGILTYTTSSNDLTYGFTKLLSPLNKIINTEELSMILSLSIKFIPIIFLQINKVYKAQISRGLTFKGNIKEKCDKLLAIVIPSFTLSLKRSDNISDILDIRGYDVNKKRSKYKTYNKGLIDKVYLLIHIILLIFTLVEEL